MMYPIMAMMSIRPHTANRIAIVSVILLMIGTPIKSKFGM